MSGPQHPPAHSQAPPHPTPPHPTPPHPATPHPTPPHPATPQPAQPHPTPPHPATPQPAQPHPTPPHPVPQHPPVPPNAPAQPTTNVPPTGWTHEETLMYRDYYWAGKPGDIKDMLDKEFHLRNAQPIWTQLPEYSNVLFIFEATPSTDKTNKPSYYVWNGIESSVCFIDAHGIGEIQQTINKLGKGKGDLSGLKLVPVTLA